MKQILIAFTIALQTSFVFAHGDHPPKVAACLGKPCTKEQVEKALPVALDFLVSKGKIAEGWKTAKVESIEQKTFKKGPEWVAKLTDEKQTDAAKKNLFVFITLKGVLAGANNTGE